MRAPSLVPAARRAQLLEGMQAPCVGLELAVGERQRVGAEEQLQRAGVAQLIQLARSVLAPRAAAPRRPRAASR